MPESQVSPEQPANQTLPNLKELLKILSDFKGKNAFEINPEKSAGKRLGNHGDKLMYEVFRKILTRAEINLVSTPEAADLFIVRPNGAMLESYEFPKILAKLLRSLADKPLVIFPSSALFPTIDPSFIFHGRFSKTIWIFRERFSYEQITKKWGSTLSTHNVDLYLDHDVVASGNEFVPELIGTPQKSEFLLLAGRIDSETKDDFQATMPRNKQTSNTLVLSFKQKVLSMIALNSGNFMGKYLATLIYGKRMDNAADRLFDRLPLELRSELMDSSVPVVKADLSSVFFQSYENYKKGIREASFVVTDRLHVALPAAILGKRVFLVEAGYHKLTGVYEQSLKSLPNVTLFNAYDQK